MKKIASLILGAALIAFAASGQDATQQQLDKLSGQIQDLYAGQGLLTKRLDAMEKEISDLRDKINAAPAPDAASRADLQSLAQQVQEIDQKRQADRDMILKALNKLGKTVGSSAAPSYSKPEPEPAAAGDGSPTAAPSGPQKGYYYTVQSGNTIAAIAKAYNDQGVKVGIGDILKANPKVNPNKLYVGQKIFIPDPNAK